jgi:formylglycine-generating enzyme required for sulfatase activity
MAQQPPPARPWPDLDRLFAELREAGHYLTPRQQDDAQRALALASAGIIISHAPDQEGIRALLMPILAKSPAERADLAARLDVWLGPAFVAPPTAAPVLVAGNPERIAAATRRWRLAVVTVASLSVLLIAGFLIARYLEPPMPPAVERKVVSEPAKVENPVRFFRDQVTFVETQVSPVYPWVRSGIALLPLAVFGTWLLSRWQRWRLWRRYWESLPGGNMPRFRLAPAASHLFAGGQLRLAAQNLRRHRRAPTGELDPARTVAATAAAAGRFIPVHRARPETPGHIVLIEERSTRDHLARLFDVATARLCAEGVHVERYYFRGTPRHLRRDDVRRSAVSLDEVVAKSADERLVVLGTADDLVQPGSGRVLEELRLAKAWSARALLNARPPEQWGPGEQLLLDEGFLLGTASTPGLQALGERLASGDPDEPTLLEGLRLARRAGAARPGPSTAEPPPDIELLGRRLKALGAQLRRRPDAEETAVVRAGEIVEELVEFLRPPAAGVGSRERVSGLVQELRQLLGAARLIAARHLLDDLAALAPTPSDKPEGQRGANPTDKRSPGSDQSPAEGRPAPTPPPMEPVAALASLLAALGDRLRAAISEAEDEGGLSSLLHELLGQLGDPASLPAVLETLEKLRESAQLPALDMPKLIAAIRAALAAPPPETPQEPERHLADRLAAEARAALEQIGIRQASPAAIEILIRAAAFAATDAEPELSATRVFCAALQFGRTTTSSGDAAACRALARVIDARPDWHRAAETLFPLFHEDDPDGARRRLTAGFSATVEGILHRAAPRGSRDLTAAGIVQELAASLIRSSSSLLPGRLSNHRVDLSELARAIRSALASASSDHASLTPGTIFRDVDAPWCPEMVVIPAGSFVMGSPEHEKEREASEGPPHGVRIGQPFALGRYAVTFEEYDRFCEETGREKPGDQGWGRGRRPVINVSWDDAQAYCAWLAEHTGRPYRLPSEAEWEYACRAGTQTAFSWGDEPSPDRANFAGSVRRTMEVGAYPSNAWGLHEMHGNVREWCGDGWHRSYEGHPSDGSSWIDDTHLPGRVMRGGSWSLYPGFARSAFRDWFVPGYRISDLGFRVSRTLTSP